MLLILKAIFLGVVEGLTEFLPISSTGHLIVAERVIGFKDAAELFTVVVQIGAIAAVVWYYRVDILSKVTGLFKREDKSIKFWVNLIIATIPAGLIGLALDKTLQKYAVPSTVAWALILGGMALLAVEVYQRAPRSPSAARLDEVTPKQALGVGFVQVMALIPGVSRSGATIIGGLLAGLDRVTATAFSFYLSIPIMVLASGYKLAKHHSEISSLPGGAAALAAGVISAFVTGLFAVSWLIKYISRHDFKGFAYYRIAFGCLVLALLALGYLN